jgi:hypothetical protein
MTKKRSKSEKELDESHRWAVKNGRPHDAQRDRVYKFDSMVLGASNREDWSMTQCQEFVNYVWHCYFGNNSVPPYLYDGRGRACASANDEKMYVPRWARNRSIILHELSHAILSRWTRYDYNFKMEAHGPEFVRMHAEIQGALGNWATVTFVKLAKAYGLRVANKGKVPTFEDEVQPHLRKESWHSRC